jgi:cellulose synthase/poly-beta-1,6-N-acetylglucosamine synthase-like glycosyltransferase
MRVAVLVASKDGAATIRATVHSAVTQADVYVVSDGSSDATAEVARAAGAQVLELTENLGKPAAIHRALNELRLTERYDAIAVLDDDTIIAPDFIARAVEQFRKGVAIVVGRTITRWNHENRWNVWLAARAYAYWRYQATLRRGQSALGVMNCISGSNSLFRSSVLAEVAVERTPYIVDDTYWTLETHRRKLGRIVYAPRAHAWICDPITFRDWYRQNLRWLWGMYQGIVGHRVGIRRTRFDAAALLLMFDWTAYVLGLPVMVALVVWLGWFSLHLALVYFAGYLAWTVIAAVATRKWRMVLMTPAIAVIDVIYRVTFVHALVKVVREPRVSSCRWVSPARY